MNISQIEFDKLAQLLKKFKKTRIKYGNSNDIAWFLNMLIHRYFLLL